MRFLIISLVVLTSACTAKKTSEPETNGRLSVEWSVSPKPAKVGPLQLTLKVKDKTGQPVKATIINVEGNMTHPGMMPLHAKAQEVQAGEYAAALNLNMPGDWILLADIKLPDGSVVQKSLNLFGVK